jgi:hypothetical protein
MILSQAPVRETASAISGFQSSLQAHALRVGPAFSLQFAGRPWNTSLRGYPGGSSNITVTIHSHRAAATLHLHFEERVNAVGSRAQQWQLLIAQS